MGVPLDSIPLVWYTNGMNKTCSCGSIRRKGGRDCLSCHAANMRRYRREAIKKPTQEQLVKIRTRQYLKTYVKRGKIEKLPCEVCGIVQSEAHHPDYSKPLKIVWLCRSHHLELHKIIKKHKNV